MRKFTDAEIARTKEFVEQGDDNLKFHFDGTRFTVTYLAGMGRDTPKAVDYMIVWCLTRDGEAVELYDEFILDGAEDEQGRPLYVEDECGNLDWNPEFESETYSYGILKTAILKQAEEYDVDPETLKFHFDDNPYRDEDGRIKGE